MIGLVHANDPLDCLRKKPNMMIFTYQNKGKQILYAQNTLTNIAPDNISVRTPALILGSFHYLIA